MRGRNKFGAKKTTVDGYVFDSRAEARRYAELKLLGMAGKLSGLKVHPSYILQDTFKVGKKTIRPIHYEADFSYIDHDGKKMAVEDVKAIRTPVFNIKEKLFRFRYPHLDFRIIDVRRTR